MGRYVTVLKLDVHQRVSMLGSAHRPYYIDMNSTVNTTKHAYKGLVARAVNTTWQLPVTWTPPIPRMAVCTPLQPPYFHLCLRHAVPTTNYQKLLPLSAGQHGKDSSCIVHLQLILGNQARLGGSHAQPQLSAASIASSGGGCLGGECHHHLGRRCHSHLRGGCNSHLLPQLNGLNGLHGGLYCCMVALL